MTKKLAVAVALALGCSSSRSSPECVTDTMYVALSSGDSARVIVQQCRDYRPITSRPMKPIHIGSAQIDATPLRHKKDVVAEGRIISELPSYGEFVRECYAWWMDGCYNCVACAVVDSYESNESSSYQFHWRMRLLYDLTGGKHGDGIELPRIQRQLFTDVRPLEEHVPRMMRRGFKNPSGAKE